MTEPRVCPHCLDPACDWPVGGYCQYEKQVTAACMDSPWLPLDEAVVKSLQEISRIRHSNEPPMNPAPGI